MNKLLIVFMLLTPAFSIADSATAPQTGFHPEAIEQAPLSNVKTPDEILPPRHPSDHQPAEHNLECVVHCKKGKACGNSCISRAKECHKPKGYACDVQ